MFVNTLETNQITLTNIILNAKADINKLLENSEMKIEKEVREELEKIEGGLKVVD